MAILAGLALLARYLFATFLNTFNPDWRDFDQLARNILTGNGFSLSITAPFVPATIRDPLYPLFLSWIYSIFGVSHSAVFIAQGLLSTLNVLLIFKIGHSLFRYRVGLYAGFWSAVYVPFLYLAADFLTETLYTFLMLVATLLAIRSQRNPLPYLIGAGFVLGLATLTRSDGLLFGVLLGVVVLYFATNKKRTGIGLIGMLIALLLTLSPWVWRNYKVTGRLMLRDPSTFFAAMRAGAGYPFHDPLYNIIFEYPGGLPEDLRQEHQNQVLASYWRDLQQRPLSLLTFRFEQLLRLWMDGAQNLPLKEDRFFDLLRSGDYVYFVLRSLAFGVFGVLNLIFALIGSWIGIRKHRHAILLLALPLYITLLNIPIFASSTYSMPGRATLMPFVAVTVLAIRSRFSPRNRWKECEKLS